MGAEAQTEVRLDRERAGPVIEQLEDASRSVRAAGFRLMEWSLPSPDSSSGPDPAVAAALAAAGDELVAVSRELAEDARWLVEAVAAAEAADRSAVEVLADLATEAGSLAVRWSTPLVVEQVVLRVDIATRLLSSGPLGLAPWWSPLVGIPQGRPDTSVDPSVDLGGDGGGGLTRQWLAPVAAAEGTDAAARGRDVAQTLLALTAGGAEGLPVLAEDEIGMVELGPTTFAVVLPGVVDVSRPRVGLDPVHRSVRDFDQHALQATTDRSPEADAYAQMVARALDEHAVPIGSTLLLVGHSYGGGAAVRLAASPGLLAGRRVTHVVAAGYHADPWLEDVPVDTQVLVLQNEHDLLVAAEAVVHRAVGPGPAEGDTATTLVHRFSGGRSRAGHGQEHYLAELASSQDPAVVAFLAELDLHGYAEPGHLSSIDVSVR